MNNHFIYIKLSVMMGDFVITKYYSSTAKFLYCPSLCSKTPPSASIQAWVRLRMSWDADLTSLDFRTHWQHTWAPLELQASPLRFPLGILTQANILIDWFCEETPLLGQGASGRTELSFIFLLLLSQFLNTQLSWNLWETFRSDLIRRVPDEEHF